MKPKSLKTRYTGKSFATASRKISDKYKDRDTNMLSKRSFLAEIEELMKMQELSRAQEASVATMQENRRVLKAFGGELMKYANGTPELAPYLGLTDPQLNLKPSPLQTFQSGLETRSSFNTQALGMPLAQLPKVNFQANPLSLNTLPSTMPESVKSNTLAPFDDRVKTELGNELSKLKNKYVAEAKAKNENKFMKGMLAPMIAGKTAEFLGGIGMLASGYDRYAPILNPYESQSRRELEAMQFDITPVQQRLQQEGARGRSSVSGIQNEAVRQALLQNTQSEIMGRTQEAMLSGQQQENQYRQTRAAGLQGLGAEQVAARNMAEQLTTQSKAGWQQGFQNVIGSVGQAGQEITNSRASIAQQQLLASAMRTKDFGMGNAANIIKKAAQMQGVSEDEMYRIMSNMNEQEMEAYATKLRESLVATQNRTKTTTTKKFGGYLPGLKF